MKAYGKVAVRSHSFFHSPTTVHVQLHASRALSLGNRLSVRGRVGSRLAGFLGEEKNVLPQQGIEPRFLGCPDRSLATALTATCHYDISPENTSRMCCYTT